MTPTHMLNPTTKARPPIVIIAIAALIAAVIVAALVITTRDNNTGAAGPAAPPDIDAVVDQLMDDGLPIHTVAPRTPGLLARQSVDVIFALDQLGITDVGTSGRVEGIIHTFGNLQGRDAWVESARGLGGVGFVRGDELWAVSSDSDLPESVQVAETLAETIGAQTI